MRGRRFRRRELGGRGVECAKHKGFARRAFVHHVSGRPDCRLGCGVGQRKEDPATSRPLGVELIVDHRPVVERQVGGLK